MNYPFRQAIIDYVKGADAEHIMDRIMSIVENYPKPVLDVLMNLLGTHDTERILTVIAGEPMGGNGREWQANTKLSSEQRELGIKLLKIAVGIQYTLPGFPCVYYGDEVGMEGYRDPFNRGCFPWGKEEGSAKLVQDPRKYKKELLRARRRRDDKRLFSGQAALLYPPRLENRAFLRV